MLPNSFIVATVLPIYYILKFKIAFYYKGAHALQLYKTPSQQIVVFVNGLLKSSRNRMHLEPSSVKKMSEKNQATVETWSTRIS